MVNFARLYPRYRDLAYLATYMARWDQAILALLPHSRYRLPSLVGPHCRMTWAEPLLCLFWDAPHVQTDDAAKCELQGA